MIKDDEYNERGDGHEEASEEILAAVGISSLSTPHTEKQLPYF